MIVIACLDDNGGMMFNHRRQSQDRMLRAHIAALAPFERWIEKIIIFRWHRTYPADQHFDIDLSGGNWKICESVEFTGHSHERITIEVYLR